MSPEMINMQQAMAVVPFLKMFLMMILICIGVWYGTVALCAVVEKVKNKIMIKDAR